MAKLISPVRTQLMYRSAAYNLWKSIYGPMVPGLFNGYAVTCFDSEIELRSHLTHYKYSELIQQCVWKVGTAEITDVRLEKMFKEKKAPLRDPRDIWDRYMIPFTDRLSKYAGDTKSFEAGQCAWMKDVLVKKYIENDNVAILMIPLIIGYSGKPNHLEDAMSEMLEKSGAEVHNNKAIQKSRERSAPTDVYIGLPEMKADKQLKLPKKLADLGFEIHSDFKKKKRASQF